MSFEDLDPLENCVREAVSEGAAPSVVLACGRGPDRRRRLACGHAAVVPVERCVQETTLFDLASLTKVLATTWLSMRWWELGRLDLDAPLDALLPDYYPADKGGLSVRLLLCHAAGLPSGVRLRDDYVAVAEGGPERQEIIGRFLQAPIEAAPGQRTLYSDIGPILVGDLLEQLGGARLDRLCADELYGPAGLADTFFVHRDDPVPAARRDLGTCAATEDCPWRGGVLVGEVHDENAWLLRGVAGHAGLFAPIADLERIARAFLGFAGDARITPATLASLTCRQHVAPDSSRAFGWDTPRPNGPGGSRLSRRAFGHTGFTGTSMWIDPEAELYVIVLTNRVHPTRDNRRFLDVRPHLHDIAVDALGR